MRSICSALALTVAAAAGAQNAPTPNPPLHLEATVLGTGSPVVLIGGGLLGADGWGGVPPLLAKTHRVINAQTLAVEYGLGNRPLPSGYSLHTEADALRASLDSMHVDAADLIGMSHGGVTALLFALENPRRVRTLTLIEPPAFWLLPNHGNDDPGARAARPAHDRRLQGRSRATPRAHRPRAGRHRRGYSSLPSGDQCRADSTAAACGGARARRRAQFTGVGTGLLRRGMAEVSAANQQQPVAGGR